MDKYMTTIGEIAEVYDGPHATPKKIKSGPYFLSISSLNQGWLDLSKSAFLSDEDFKKWTKRVTPVEGDLLFSYETRLGEAALMPSGIKACLGRRMGLLRPKPDKVLSDYLLYAYLSPAFQRTIVGNTIRGATVDRIALNDLPNFEIRIPPLDEQKRAASILKKIDKKIEINIGINAELEAMAEALYNYWFIQFDFPNANGQPYKTSGGKMCYDQILKREIPEGWKACELGDVISFKRGISYKSSDIQESGIPFINLNSFSLGGQFKPEGTKYFNGKFKPDSQLRVGDLVVAITDVTRNADITGKAFVVPDIFEINPLISCDVASVFSTVFGVAYLEQLFNSRSYHQYIKHYASGTLVLHLDLNGIKWFKTPLPPKELLGDYEEHCKSLFKQRDILLKENMQLKAIRNWLLPMLMSGQVKIK